MIIEIMMTIIRISIVNISIKLTNFAGRNHSFILRLQSYDEKKITLFFFRLRPFTNRLTVL